MVITDVDDDIREANRQLNNIDFYNKKPNDQTEFKRNKVNNTINKLKLQRLLDDKTAKNIQTLEAEKPNFYVRIKIYKEGNPGRSIISSVNCHKTKKQFTIC